MIDMKFTRHEGRESWSLCRKSGSADRREKRTKSWRHVAYLCGEGETMRQTSIGFGGKRLPERFGADVATKMARLGIETFGQTLPQNMPCFPKMDPANPRNTTDPRPHQI